MNLCFLWRELTLFNLLIANYPYIIFCKICNLRVTMNTIQWKLSVPSVIIVDYLIYFYRRTGKSGILLKIFNNLLFSLCDIKQNLPNSWLESELFNILSLIKKKKSLYLCDSPQRYQLVFSTPFTTIKISLCKRVTWPHFNAR